VLCCLDATSCRSGWVVERSRSEIHQASAVPVFETAWPQSLEWVVAWMAFSTCSRWVCSLVLFGTSKSRHSLRWVGCSTEL
jgi:hypothetical protein